MIRILLPLPLPLSSSPAPLSRFGISRTLVSPDTTAWDQEHHRSTSVRQIATQYLHSSYHWPSTIDLIAFWSSQQLDLTFEIDRNLSKAIVIVSWLLQQTDFVLPLAGARAKFFGISSLFAQFAQFTCFWDFFTNLLIHRAIHARPSHVIQFSGFIPSQHDLHHAGW